MDGPPSGGGKKFFGMSKNEALIAGIGGSLLLGFTVYRYSQQKKASDAAATAAAAAQAPGTGAGTSDGVDPATGFPYGSTEDAAALTAQSGYNSPLAGLGYSDQSYLYGGSPYYPGSPNSGGGFTSNAQWAQAAEDYLVNTAGGNSNTVGNALGKYITGQNVTDTNMQAVINQAIAFEGYPPIPGPDGYPPSIRETPVTPTQPSGGGGTTTTGRAQAPSGLKVLQKTSTSVTLQWNQISPPASSFTVAGYQTNGKTVAYQTVSVPDAPGQHGVSTISGLHSKWQYHFNVWANAGTGAPPHSTVSVTLP